jgi:hypothetical protein
MHLSNPELPILRHDWQGNPSARTGVFFHPGYPFELKWRDILKW